MLCKLECVLGTRHYDHCRQERKRYGHNAGEWRLYDNDTRFGNKGRKAVRPNTRQQGAGGQRQRRHRLSYGSSAMQIGIMRRSTSQELLSRSWL